MTSGVILTRSGTIHKPRVIRHYETSTKLHHEPSEQSDHFLSRWCPGFEPPRRLRCCLRLSPWGRWRRLGGTGYEIEKPRTSMESKGRVAEATSELEHRRAQLHGAFGDDTFGRFAEKAARSFGTPRYIVGQTAAVVAWVVVNSTRLSLGFAWDVYPFIALNLLFSLQAAYAAPLILLAQTRQADRDKVHSERVENS